MAGVMDRDFDSPEPDAAPVKAAAPAKAGQATMPQLGHADSLLGGLSQGLASGVAMRKAMESHADGGMIGGVTSQLAHANAGRASQKCRDYKK